MIHAFEWGKYYWNPLLNMTGSAPVGKNVSHQWVTCIQYPTITKTLTEHMNPLYTCSLTFMAWNAGSTQMRQQAHPHYKKHLDVNIRSSTISNFVSCNTYQFQILKSVEIYFFGILMKVMKYQNPKALIFFFIIFTK